MELEKYRDGWIAEGINDYIGFYTREFFCLDNFSAFAVEIDGHVYPTAEHAYQSAKFIYTSPEIAKKIWKSRSPGEAKAIAHNNRENYISNWEGTKVDIMEKILRAKLNQHPYVREKLMQTKKYPICLDSPIDSFWGIGPDRKGENVLGKLWMKLRAELQQQTKAGNSDENK